MVPFPDLIPALPETVLSALGIFLLLLGVMINTGDQGGRLMSRFVILALLLALLLVSLGIGPRTVTFEGMFVSDGFGSFMKGLVLLGGAFSVLLSLTWNERRKIDHFEYAILILFSTIGMMAMISANDLISLYVGFELQSLPLYVLAAFRRDTVRSTEAGLKYFVLGALSSGMLLFGASLIYGFGGSTNFEHLASVLTDADGQSIGLVIGIVFLSVGLAFKCSAVPFHMWTPDVYEGSPTPVTAFFAVAPKTAALALMLRVMLGPLGHMEAQWSQIIFAISLLSMIVGAYAAISQTNIKRLMAYSSIGHVGYALIGLAAGTPEGIQGVLVYMTIYLFMTLGSFAVILCMERNGQPVETISDLSGLSRTQPLLALALAIFMFSLAGVPPLAGFISKLMVFMSAIHAGAEHPSLYWLAVMGVLTSVVGCFYYIRVVKLMYFDAPVSAPFDRVGGGVEARVITLVSALAVCLFILHPSWLIEPAAAAAKSLFLLG